MTVPVTALLPIGGQDGSAARGGTGRGCPSIAPFVHATSELPERTSSIATTGLVDWLAERVVMPEHLSIPGALVAAYVREL
jgi:hypothetical protein